MQDEVSASMHIAIVVWCTGALLGVVCGVLIMSLNILRDYTDKYSDAIVSSTNASIVDAVKEEAQSGAIIYSRIESSINSIDAVKIEGKGYIYKYNDPNCQNTMSLLTTYKNTTFRINIQNGDLVKSLKTVVLTEVP